jgi:hypothetical protein
MNPKRQLMLDLMERMPQELWVPCNGDGKKMCLGVYALRSHPGDVGPTTLELLFDLPLGAAHIIFLLNDNAFSKYHALADIEDYVRSLA